jgi:hypothetical protein
MEPQMTRTSHSYYVVMQDHGKRGLEAIVDPEMTRRSIVSAIKSGEYKLISFIHHVDGLYIEDVTAELIDEAEAELKEEYRATRSERIAQMHDHVRDLRKHEAV